MLHNCVIELHHSHISMEDPFQLDGVNSMSRNNPITSVFGFLNNCSFTPYIYIIGIGDIIIHPINSAKHCIFPSNFPGEKRHPLVLGNLTINWQYPEIIKIFGTY